MLTLALAVLLQTAQAPATAPTAPSQPLFSSQSPEFLARRLAGTWEQDSTEDNQFGQMLTLSSDGTATLATAIVEDLNYNFDGKKLILVDEDDPDEVRASSTIVLTGDTMKETNDETHESATFVRLSPPPASKQAPASITGEWKRDTRGLIFDASLSEKEKQRRLALAENGRYYYEPDGRLLVRIPIVAQTGKWSVNNDGKLHLEIGGKSRDVNIEFEGDELTLINPDRSRETFTRFER